MAAPGVPVPGVSVPGVGGHEPLPPVGGHLGSFEQTFPHVYEAGEIGNPGAPRAEEAAKKEGLTFGKVALGFARGLAGLTGGAIYGTGLLVGGALTVATAPVIAAIALPASFIGIGVGALVGSLSSSSNATEGIENGLKAGQGISIVIGSIPGAILYNTVGRIGASLLAFSAAGKRESTQKQELIDEKIGWSAGERNKTTGEKLRDVFAIVSLLIPLINTGKIGDRAQGTKKMPNP